MEQTVKVSIVTPSYNQGQFIGKTIESVLNQTYKHIEYILVDGGSSDSTMEVVNHYRDKIDIVIHEKDKGQSDAINKGFKLASGELVGWINSDDILYPDAVERAVQSYQSNKREPAVIMPTSMNWIDSDGVFIKEGKVRARSRLDLINKDYRVVQPGSFYNTVLVKKVGLCDVSIHYCMDLDLILRLSQLEKIVFIDGPLAGFRTHATTKTSTGNLDFLNDIEQCIRKYGMAAFSKNALKLKKEKLKIIIKNALGIINSDV